MNILLIRPMPPKETIGLQHVMICEPLELEYLAGNISSDTANITILDMIIEKRPLEYYIKKYNPDIIGITGYITHIGIMKDYSDIAKKVNKNIIVVVGGVHAEVIPSDFLHKNIDYIIYDDPIGTFVRIVTEFKIQKEQNPNFIPNKVFIKGTYKEGIHLEKTSEFPYLPPDRSKVAIYRNKYYYMFHNPCALIKTSFGCPFDCSFCFCKEVTGRKYFAREIHSVIEELKNIPEREIYIVDDDFLFNPKRLNEFCDLLEQEKLDKRFLVYGRADFIANNEEIIKRLAKNGLSAVIVGIESVRKKDLIDFNKKTTVETNFRAVEILKKYDIELYATMILNLDYSKKDFRELEQHIKKMDISFVNLQPLTPLPGTDIFDHYAKDIIVPREDYAKWDLAHIVLKPKYMSIREYYWQIIRLYYRVIMRPKNIFRMIRKYGLKEVLKMSWGSSFVTRQYLQKMIKGE